MCSQLVPVCSEFIPAYSQFILVCSQLIPVYSQFILVCSQLIPAYSQFILVCSQLEYLEEAIDTTIANGDPIPFKVIADTEIIAERNNYLTIDNAYTVSRAKSPVFTQQRNTILHGLIVSVKNIGQYLKVQYHANTKQLVLWGFDFVYAIDGKVKLPGRLAEQEILIKKIIAKHTADGAISLLEGVYDMAAFENDYNSMQGLRVLKHEEEVNWKILIDQRHKSMKTLRKMLRLIGRDLLKQEGMDARALEY